MVRTQLNGGRDELDPTNEDSFYSCCFFTYVNSRNEGLWGAQ